MTKPFTTSRQRMDLAWLCALAALVFVAHFLTGNGYGFHRDELQFLDDARHLQWGYVAFPPITSFFGRIAIALFGISPPALRLPAVAANALVLVLTGLLARELGGHRAAQLLASAAIFPICLVLSSMLQYGSFDLLAWVLLSYFTARLLRTGDARNWIGVGIAVGIGVLSKYTIAFPLLSLFVALLLLPDQRQALRQRWFWLGALAAVLIATPNLLWLAQHHWITLQMEHTIHLRDVRIGRADGFFPDQLKFTLLALPLAVAGLIWLLRNTRFRLLSALYLGPMLLLVLMRGRGYYLIPGYPLLFAAGAVALESALRRRSPSMRLALRTVCIACLILNLAAAVWSSLPVWPVDSPAWKWQMKNNYDMANEIGWPELVAQVAAIRDQLPAADQQRLGVVAENYGEAGALALYGPRFGLPTPISPVNDFYFRGYPTPPPETLIVVGNSLQNEARHFQSCSIAGHMTMPHNVQNEESQDHPEILVCHHLLQPWPLVWSRIEAFG